MIEFFPSKTAQRSFVGKKKAGYENRMKSGNLVVPVFQYKVIVFYGKN